MQLEARAKWDAWTQHKGAALCNCSRVPFLLPRGAGMAAEEARRLYVAKANELAGKYA